MDKVFDLILSKVGKKGLEYIFLVIAICYFYKELNKVQETLAHCQKILLECYAK